MPADRRAVLLVLAATLPLLVLGLVGLGDTLRRANDPCHTWGDRYGMWQEGGGTSPGPSGCEGGVSWTSESFGNAVLRIVWLPTGAAVALALGAWGLRARDAVPIAVGAALLLAMAVPLTLGITMLVAGLPAAAFVGAARLGAEPSRAGRLALRVVGALAADAVLWMLSNLVQASLQGLSWVALPFGLVFIGGLALVAWLGWRPWAAASPTAEAP